MNRKITSAVKGFNLSMARYYQGKKLTIQYRGQLGQKHIKTITVGKVVLAEKKKGIPRLNIPNLNIYTIGNEIFFFKKGDSPESRVIGFHRSSSNDVFLVK
jgi:hypothetical protein